MGVHLPQEMKTMMYDLATMHSFTKVAGGMVIAMIQTSMVSIMVDHTHLMLME